MPEAKVKPAGRAALVFIFVTVLLDVLSFGVIIPVLPKLVEGFLGGNTAAAAKWFGLFGTLFALMQFFGAPILGGLSDRFGRRPVILLSCFGLGVDFVVMALAPSLGWLLAGRIVSGLTASNFATAGAYIADVTPPKNRAASFGLLGAAFGAGFVLGPALGGMLGHISPRLPFWVAAVFALLNACWGLFVLPESLPPARRRPFAWSRANPVGSLRLLRSHPELLALAGVSLLYFTAHTSLPTVFVLYAGYRYGWNTRDVGLVLALVGVCSIFVQAGLTRAIVARFGERKALLGGLAAGIVTFAIYGLAPTGFLFCLGVPFGAFMGLYGPASNAIMTRRVSRKEQGRLQGANMGIMGLSGLYSPALFTGTFAWFITAPRALPGAPYLLASGLMVFATLLAWFSTRQAPATASRPNP